MVIAEKYLAVLFVTFLTLSAVSGATYLDSVNRSNLAAQQVAFYQSRIDSLNTQINTLDIQISSLEAANTQLGNTNSALVNNTSSLRTQIVELQVNIQLLQSQITLLQSDISSLTTSNQSLQTQVTQLANQVTRLQAQITNFTRIGALQISKIIANQIYLQGDTDLPNVQRWTVGSPEWRAIPLGTIAYAGYITISWVSSGKFNFNLQVYDVNISTAIAGTGTYTMPVGANATNNAWFNCWTAVNGSRCYPDLTYSITYWY